MNLKDSISTYSNFPKKGIEFKDVLGIIQEPDLFKRLILKMSSNQILKDAEAIISIDARGFIFGSAISFYSSKPMIVARKPGKLPGELLKKSYKLEYGENSLSIQKQALKKFNSYVIVDDLLATGGTAAAASKLIRKAGGNLIGYAFIIELTELKGREQLNSNLFVESLLRY